MRARTITILAATACAGATVLACGSSADSSVEKITKSTQASTVAVDLFDASGNELGSCSGTLVSADLVLTAGHCAAGAARWTIHADGATSTATRAVTPWKDFRSNLSHPDHADLALLVLKKPIRLDHYPAIASSPLDDGATAIRFHRGGADEAISASPATVKDGAPVGFRLNYTTKLGDGERLDTGGALVDAVTGDIHGVVSGRGTTTGLLYVARTDGFADWIAKAASCSGEGSKLAVRTYGGGGGGGGGGYGGGGGDDWGGYGGDGDEIDAGCHDAGSGGSSSGGSSSGGTDGDGPGGSSGGTDGSGSDACPPPPTCDGPDCPGDGGESGGGSSSGSSGASSSGSSGSSSGGSSGSSSGGSGGGSDGDGDGCQGSGDNPDICPPGDDQDCDGPDCGGCAGAPGCSDGTIDYGDCGCTGKGTGTPPVLR